MLKKRRGRPRSMINNGGQGISVANETYVDVRANLRPEGPAKNRAKSPMTAAAPEIPPKKVPDHQPFPTGTVHHGKVIVSLRGRVGKCASGCRLVARDHPLERSDKNAARPRATAAVRAAAAAGRTFKRGRRGRAGRLKVSGEAFRTNMALKPPTPFVPPNASSP